MVAPDGSNLRRLAGDIPSWDIEAAWSPDSQRITFVSSRENWGNEIYVMDFDGTNQKRLTHNMVTERQPAWSPDGSKIVFSLSLDEDTTIAVMNADGKNDIFAINADGTGPLNLTKTEFVEELSPSWRPVPLAVSVRGRLATQWGAVKLRR